MKAEPRITVARKRRFADQMLAASTTPVGFVDVGAGGPLKMPWTLLPPGRVKKYNIEPEEAQAGVVPLCASDREGRAVLFVARDPRSSSLHPAAESFIERFANDGTTAVREFEVECVTLDAFLAGQWDRIDLVDINAEGHDARVIQGAAGLLGHGTVSLIRVEVLLTEVWQGQGWFSDIDHALRMSGYDLLTVDLESDRPAAVRRLQHAGEVLWGKALYAPSADAWQSALMQGRDAAEDRVLKAVALYVIADALGRASELFAAADRAGVLRRVASDEIRRLIRWVFQYAEVEARAHELLRALNARRWGGALARLVKRH